jgi:predicted DNA-binding transcriptional regulator
MSPINAYTFGLAKKHYKEYERFTTRQLLDRIEEELSINQQKSIMKTLSNLYKLGFLRRDTVENKYLYYWTRKSYQCFKDDEPTEQKVMSDEEFDQEHAAWTRMVEERRLQREHMTRSLR